MTHTCVSPHVLSSQLLYSARLTAQGTAEEYRREVYRRLEQLKHGLREWEYSAVLNEVEYRLAVLKM